MAFADRSKGKSNVVQFGRIIIQSDLEDLDKLVKLLQEIIKTLGYPQEGRTQSEEEREEQKKKEEEFKKELAVIDAKAKEAENGLEEQVLPSAGRGH